MAQERDIYIQQINIFKEEVDKKEKEIVSLSMQLEGLRSNGVSQKQVPSMPPKASKCKNCEVVLRNNQMYQKQILGYTETIKELQKDIQCLC